MKSLPLAAVFGLALVALCAATPSGFDWSQELYRVDTISSMDASVCPLRNLLITHHYQLIGGNMKSMLNVNQSQAASTQANWPSIAAWASNAVGNNIRNETLQYLVREIFRGWPQALVDALLKVAGGVDTWDFVRKLLAQMGRGLCEGNRVVFHEVGGAFAAFGVAFDALAQPDAQKLAAYLAMFDPKTAQQLADAMQQYYAAMWEADVGVRAQRIAWANWLVGLHEQTILQQYIVEAFPPDFNVTILGKHVTVPMHALCTRMITIAFAKDFLWATADVAPPPAPAPEWPPELAHLTLPGAAAVYDQLVTSQGVPPDSMRGTAAGDWTSLRDRMRFVVPMFRSRQAEKSIDCPIFSEANLKQINAGIVPAESDLCFLNCCSHSKL